MHASFSPSCFRNIAEARKCRGRSTFNLQIEVHFTEWSGHSQLFYASFSNFSQDWTRNSFFFFKALTLMFLYKPLLPHKWNMEHLWLNTELLWAQKGFSNGWKSVRNYSHTHSYTQILQDDTLPVWKQKHNCGKIQMLCNMHSDTYLCRCVCVATPLRCATYSMCQIMHLQECICMHDFYDGLDTHQITANGKAW